MFSGLFMRMMPWVALLMIAAAMGCGRPVDIALGDGLDCKQGVGNGGVAAPDWTRSVGSGALLASRFSSLDAFKTVVQVSYFGDTRSAVADSNRSSGVRLCYCSGGVRIASELASGVSQDDIMKVKAGGLWDRVGLVFRAPFAIANRADLERVYTLSRRLPMVFAEGDPSFYDLAEHCVKHINTPEIAFLTARDTSEKGYLNSFNHITAQAFITSIFSEELADLVADLHERKNMPALTTGRFTPAQLTDTLNNPIENYVDMINNEWGQELGKRLGEKYQIDRETWWTPLLLANYLNDIQGYCSWAFQIGCKPFLPEDELVIDFADKLNVVMANRYG